MSFNRLNVIPVSKSERYTFWNLVGQLYREGKIPGVRLSSDTQMVFCSGAGPIKDFVVRQVNEAKKSGDKIVLDGSEQQLINELPESENVFVVFPSFGALHCRTLLEAKSLIKQEAA